MAVRSAIAILVLLTASVIQAQTQHPLSAPLIIGASVSDDALAESPGKILAKRLYPNPKIRKKAAWGAKSYEILPKLKDKDFKEASTIIGLDLFFWDSTVDRLDVTRNNAKKVVAEAKKKGVVILLADVPRLFNSQTRRGQVNQLIRSECGVYAGCFVFGLSGLYEKLQAEGGMKIGGKWYTLQELLPDGVHLSRVASEEVSRRLEPIYKRRPSEKSKNTQFQSAEVPTQERELLNALF